MTNYEAVKADLLSYTPTRAKIEKEIIREGLEPSDNFSLENVQTVAKIVIRILRGFVHIVSESEGGLSTSYNVEYLKKYIVEYAADNELEELVSDISNDDNITDKSDMW